MAAAAELLGSADGGSINGYGPAEGLPALRTALQQKLADKNGLKGVSAMGQGGGGGGGGSGRGFARGGAVHGVMAECSIGNPGRGFWAEMDRQGEGS
jgi:hypothetical protein